ncbi:putative zinc ribbon domain protein [Pseudobythopirellula maris]|uniref:Putative zinc ribbon domain protein n=1 Tax=Pseudobythopirellula maris TaxID=2527991 RepID=A0A5C5ZSB7_9BACT|nr:phospholipase [Pseudobythopirellula maris]TWT90442.1 putative zinc ribbon domain protein [Pseudobythopirellula maris]
MPTTISAAALRDLHFLHSQLADLRGRLERGPKQVMAHRANVAKLETAVAESHELVKQTRMAADKKQLDLKTDEARIEGWKGKLNTASSNKEFQTLKEQIEAAEMASSVAEDEILEMLGRVDQYVAGAAKAEATLQAGRDELEKVTAKVKETAAKLRDEIGRLEVQLTTAESALPSEFKDDYERVIRSKGADGLAESEGGVCGGCGQSITLNMQGDLKLNKPTFCKSCGCLLYTPAS